MTKLFPSCPLCGKTEDEFNGRLEDHLAGHLRSLALKALPSYEDDIPDEVKNENDSIDISRPQSRSTVREMRQAEDAVPLNILTSSRFWEVWSPYSSEDFGVNFLGHAHTELDLSNYDNDETARFIDFKHYLQKDNHNLGEDPILLSMLSHKMIDDYPRNQDGEPSQEAHQGIILPALSEAEAFKLQKDGHSHGFVSDINMSFETYFDDIEWWSKSTEPFPSQPQQYLPPWQPQSLYPPPPPPPPPPDQRGGYYDGHCPPYWQEPYDTDPYYAYYRGQLDPFANIWGDNSDSSEKGPNKGENLRGYIVVKITKLTSPKSLKHSGSEAKLTCRAIFGTNDSHVTLNDNYLHP
ncbi:hypothetical protein IL306_005575 [Fusarium sp. DS 682]|nr:hypothetical protein IL306_005575 [Fusarium sp. DS 682]